MENKARELREAFGSFMTGVTVVTTCVEGKGPIGFTANSFSSVSLDPALLLISIAKSSGNYDSFVGSPHFAVNVLSENQKDISNGFARPSADRFAGVAWQASQCGSPILDGVSAWFDCTMHTVVDAGDHAILIGKVEHFASAGYAGLGYYRGGYFTPAKVATEVIAGPRVVVSTIIGHENRILLVPTQSGQWTLPAVGLEHEEGADKAIGRIFAKYQPGASASFVYAVYNNTENQHQYVAFLCNTPIAEPLSGQYFELNEISGLSFEDEALASMLDRYRRESQLKNYGLYYGNHSSGVVSEIFKKVS